MKKILIQIFLSSCVWLHCQSQSIPKSKDTRPITVTSPDSVVYSFISTIKLNVKPNIDKTYFWYGNNEIHFNRGGYSGSLLNGNYEVFNTTGGLIRKGQVKEGLLDGDWNYWNHEGQLIKLEKWDEGILKNVLVFNNKGKLIRSSDMQKKEANEQAKKLKKAEKLKNKELKIAEKRKEQVLRAEKKKDRKNQAKLDRDAKNNTIKEKDKNAPNFEQQKKDTDKIEKKYFQNLKNKIKNISFKKKPKSDG